MNALFYLKYRSLINSIKQYKEDPKKLIGIVFYLGFFSLLIIGTGSGEAVSEGFRMEGLAKAPQLILSVGMMILVTIISAISWNTGTKTGINIFTLPDTQFLFTAPYHPATVLLFGMTNQLKASILSSFFLLYQIPNLRRLGVDHRDIITLFILWILTIFINQIISTFAYSFCVGNPARKKIVTVISYLVLIIPVLIFVYLYLQKHDLKEAFSGFLQSNLLYLVPVSGWGKGLLDLLYLGFSIHRLLALLCFFLVPTLLMYQVYHSNIDYYEDALTMSQELPNGKGDKEAVEAAKRKAYSKYKIRDIGINKGSGESTVFYKQWREYRRTRPYFFGGAMITVLVVLGGIAVIGNITNGGGPGPLIYWTVSAVLLYFMAFSSSTLDAFNDWQFFLLPGNPLKKVFFASILSIVLRLADLLPAYLFVTIFEGFSIGVLGLGLLLSFSLLLLINSAQILVFRILGEIENWLSTMFLFFTSMAFVAPTVILMVIASFQMKNNPMIFYLLLGIILLINFALGFLGLYFGKRYLEKGPAK